MRKLKRNRPTIGVLSGWQAYTGTVHSYLATVYRGIQAAAQDAGCNLMIGCGVSSPVSEVDRPALPFACDAADFIPIGPWNTDGLILLPPTVIEQGAPYFQGLIDGGFPFVYGGNNESGPAVTIDNEGGIELAFDHLIQHGHRQIAFISGIGQAQGDSSSRLRGYFNSLKKHRIPENPALIAQGNHSINGGYQAIQQILQQNEPFTAVICSNDESAVGAMQGLRDAGLIIPQDVAVIGFDDRLESRAQIPLLTTVRFPMFELGYQSVDLLLQILDEKVPPDTHRRIPTELIIRESCGCLPGAGSARIFDTPVKENPTSGTFSDIETQASQAMARAVYKEMWRLSVEEVEHLCCRLLDAFTHSLMHGSPVSFRHAIQQILEHIAVVGDDLYAWQGAITVLKEWAPALLDSLPYTLPSTQIDNMLHQARIAVSEIARGQYSRTLLTTSNATGQISMMTTRFFAAKTEAEIFDEINRSMPDLGIQSAAVIHFLPEGDERYAWSVLKNPGVMTRQTPQFATRQFPPPGLYSEDKPFHLIMLPLGSMDGQVGYAAFSTSLLEPLGYIVRQISAALRSVNLYGEAVKAQQMAEEANYLKSRFLSIVSHELRTPLNLIFGLSHMMLEESRAVNEKESRVNRSDLERIFVGAQHLESLIRDVLDLASSDVGQLQLVCEPLDLREVLEAVSAIGEQLAHDKELTWQTEFPPVLPRVRCDRARLRQVLINLVNNAVKFTAHGSITLSAQVNRGVVTVSVRDTGLGIPPEEQLAIFDEFRQSKRTTARGFGGLGLGLAICKRLIEMQDGQIGVYSSGEVGAGSTFFFKLPAIPAVQQPIPAPSPDAEMQHVLLLIKEEENGQLLYKHLTRQGFHVETHVLQPGLDWLSLLTPNIPDKVVLDLDITAERGWEILKTLKENPATRGISVLFYSLEKDADSGSLLDLNYLTKPLSAPDLANALLTNGLVTEKDKRSSNQSILIVDDDPGILDLHTRIVETLASGYRIIPARNGREALAYIRKERPALVLLDLMMPEIDGFEVLEIMQAEDLFRNIPVIVLTGQVLTGKDMERLNCGVVNVLAKGIFSTSETLDHVTATLSRRRRGGSETQRVVMRAMGFIHEHYANPISRADIAEFAGLSERHLTRCFRQEVGLTPMTYLNRYRVRQARVMLESGKTNITEIALDVGFSTSGYFTRVFRDEVGMSPREYLLRLSQN